MMPSNPNPQMPGGNPAGQPRPSGMPGGAPSQGSGQADQGQVKEAIMQVLQRVKSMADQYGIDLASLIAEMDQGQGRPQPPRPPVEAGAPPMPV